jgi:peroxiredoxin
MWLLSVALAVTWILLAFLAWALWQTMRQSGRILARLEALEQHPVSAPGSSPSGAAEEPPPAYAVAPSEPPPYTGLAPGTPAPAFELPDLAGNMHSLEEWRGKRVLIVFFSPRCGFCTLMAPDLAALPTNGSKDQPMPLILTNGTVHENQEWIDEYGIRCTVLLQEGMEVANQYEATGTPMGYLLDEEGRIASELAVGGPNIVALLGPAKSSPEGLNKRPVSESKIARDGLAPGTPAPGFSLAKVGGGAVTLAHYRGRPVALVFSDPQCGPCLDLAPQLEAFHRQTPHLDVVMISRGDEAANAAKVKEHGLSFPVALQKKWEVSKKYAMFATPVGYLVDGSGVIAEEVAVGPDAILGMMRRAASVGSGKEAMA